MKSFVFALLIMLLAYSSVTQAGVGCGECNSLQVKCVSKNAVRSCIGNMATRIIRCPSGTFCNVNLLPWCHKEHQPLCGL